MPAPSHLSLLQEPPRAAAFSAFLIAAADAADEGALLTALAHAQAALFPGALRASVTLPVPERTHLRVVALRGCAVLPLDSRISLDNSGAGQAFTTGEVLIRRDMSGSPLADQRKLLEGGIRSGISVPMVSGGVVYGVLNLGRGEVYDWTHEAPLLEQIASVAAAQLRLRQQRGVAEELAEALQEISRLGRELALTDDESVLLEQAGETQRRLLPGVQAYLGLLSDDGQTITMREIGRSRAVVRELPIAGSGVGCCIESRTVHEIRDAATSSLREVPLLLAAGLRSRLLAPLLAGNAVVGTLNVGRAQPDAFSGRDRAVARHLGATIATALLALRSRQRLRAARAEAEEIARLKGTFLAVMAHEMRTPLHAVVGMSQLLAGGEVSEAQRPMIETIRTSGEALARLVDDILDLSKLDSGQMAIVPEPFSLAGLVAEVGTLIQPRLAPGVGFASSMDPSLPDVLVADRGRVWQVLTNLSSNAAKFTPTGQIRLSVAPLQAREGIEITVSDSGVGIPADALERVFEPFQQADATTTRRFGGTGLGLAICKRLVEAMGGEIRVQSTLGCGTTVSFSVPGALRSHAACAETEPALLPLASALRVLVVDDNPINRTVASAQLARLDLDAVCVSCGAEARARYTETPFDLVLMDLHMPGEDGREVTRDLFAIPGPHAVFVALTADALSGVEQSCLQAGLQAVLTKPLRLEQLRSLLARVSPRQEGASATLRPPVTPVKAV